MEIIYFFIGAVTVAVLFSVGWLLRIVQMQIKQIHNLESVVNAVVSNDITEEQVRAIVDSRVDKYAGSVSREFERVERGLIDYTDELNNNSMVNMNEIHRRIDDVKRDLMQSINVNRVTNKRNVTNGDLQNEY
jgi:hypothetical protein